MTSGIAQPAFIPTTPEEMKRLGWTEVDVILVTGDVYIDAPHIGVAVIGRVLLDAGFRVGIIAQPDIHSPCDIGRLGEPSLFWGVTSGCVDSMIANFTPSGRRRRKDDMTPGERNDRRPDRAVIVYSQLIRQYFKQTRPIVLGGIEASLRRISHYDAWADTVRRSILFDAKADYLLYGMAEKTVVDLASRLARGNDMRSLRGLCYISGALPESDPQWDSPAVLLPSHDQVCRDTSAFARMFELFYKNAQSPAAQQLCQQQDTRYLIQNPPSLPPDSAELDTIYELPYSRDVHPYYKTSGRVAALETIQFSLTTHRGCFGECRFCSIAIHQGQQVISRKEDSIVREATAMTQHPDFKGIISDAGGPTANMYAMHCVRDPAKNHCTKKKCLLPGPCKQLRIDHQPQIQLLRALRAVPGIRKIFVASGLRHDLILADRSSGALYLEELLQHHVSGQLKIAPEHIDDPLLQLMGKPGRHCLEEFLRMFERLNARMPKKQFLTYYFMAAHPGCTLDAMSELRIFSERRLRVIPEQVQIFTPSPSTYSTLMYVTGTDPFSKKRIFVEKTLRGKLDQKAALVNPRHAKTKASSRIKRTYRKTKSKPHA